MNTINKENIQACFVNSNDAPKDIKPIHGFYVVESGDGNELCLMGDRDYVYSHPDVNEKDFEVNISVNLHEYIISATKGNWKYPILFSLLQSQKMVLDMLKRTK